VSDENEPIKNLAIGNVPHPGLLTKRELFAAMAMQGILSCPLSEGAALKAHEMGPKVMLEIWAGSAVQHADALIAELEKE